MEIGKNIQKFRKQKRLTQEELAKEIGMSQPAINQYERGVKTPPPNVLIALADAFSCSLDELCGRKS